ncbi:MAG: hypothetical protein KGI89_16920, partial [Euryarchaeota archaeon]|nr:hypothetical protein [Euryarchaeota archaeon]
DEPEDEERGRDGLADEPLERVGGLPQARGTVRVSVEGEAQALVDVVGSRSQVRRVAAGRILEVFSRNRLTH